MKANTMEITPKRFGVLFLTAALVGGVLALVTSVILNLVAPSLDRHVRDGIVTGVCVLFILLAGAATSGSLKRKDTSPK